MKGFSHFISGVAAVSCLPGVVDAAVAGHPLPFILGGVSALLPDTLDFKGVRLLWQEDILIVPDPLAPNYQEIAEAVAGALDRVVYAQKPLTVKLCSIQCSADSWQQYRLLFDIGSHQVRVCGGPIVNTSQEAIAPGISAADGQASYSADPRLDYHAETSIDIFDGPTFLFEPDRGTRVHVRFLPWHRGWTHSFITALVLALLCLGLFSPLAAAAVFVGFGVHILQDQFGYLGSQLLAPVSPRRFSGLGYMHALDTWPNVGAVWISLMILYWNLALSADLSPCHGNLLRYVFQGAGLPACLVWLLVKRPFSAASFRKKKSI
jgi:hypothetical protein